MNGYTILSEAIDNAFKSLNLITESKESKNIHAASQFMKESGYDDEYVKKFIFSVKNDIPNTRLADCKFMLGAVRLALNDEVTDGIARNRFNQILKLIATGPHLEEYDRNLNGVSYMELNNRFKTSLKQNLQQAKDEMSNVTFGGKSDYTIVKINSTKDASEYAKYTSWCITRSQSNYDSYTNEGLGVFYFCLKNGFENVEQKQGENCPLDEYGLSMIAVSVNMDGSCNTVTCRWNHDNGGSDAVMTDKEVSNVIGMNFYDVFHPKTKEELEATGKFHDGFAKVINNEYKYNFVNLDGEYLSDTWYDGIKSFSEGLAVVRKGVKTNFIDTEGNLISDTWFDGAGDFNEGFALVILKNKYNFINAEGQFLSDTWFDNVLSFKDGAASVKLDGKWNHLNTEGKLVSGTWFDYAHSFNGGFARVVLNGKYNFISTEGQLLSDTWFDDAYNFDEGFARVNLNGQFNYINAEGRLISGTWFDYAYKFDEGLSMVNLNGQFNFINSEGRLISDTWFNYASNFIEGFALVMLNRKWNFINTDGNLISDVWFDSDRQADEFLAKYKENLQTESIQRKRFVSSFNDMTARMTQYHAKMCADNIL